MIKSMQLTISTPILTFSVSRFFVEQVCKMDPHPLSKSKSAIASLAKVTETKLAPKAVATST